MKKSELLPPPEVPESIEVLKRAALILAVTAWETYLEDLLKEKFPPLLAAASTPAEFQAAFDAVAAPWLRADPRPSPRALVSWTGNGWRTHVQNHFANRVAALNTPNAKNVSKLLQQFLHADMESLWKWRGYNFSSTSQYLDQVIAKRGEISHVARKNDKVPAKHVVSRVSLVSFLRFLNELAIATDRIECHTPQLPQSV